jgi:hypothetical protein
MPATEGATRMPKFSPLKWLLAASLLVLWLAAEYLLLKLRMPGWASWLAMLALFSGWVILVRTPLGQKRPKPRPKLRIVGKDGVPR